MRFESGKNRVRFIGNPVSGFVFFGKVEREDGTETTKPYRRRESEGEFSLEEMINRNARMKKDGEMEGGSAFREVLCDGIGLQLPEAKATGVGSHPEVYSQSPEKLRRQ